MLGIGITTNFLKKVFGGTLNGKLISMKAAMTLAMPLVWKYKLHI